MSKPTVTNIKRHNGVAGQYSYTAKVQYPGEDTGSIEFVGDTYSQHVIMVMGNGAQVLVRDPWRHGDKLNPEWVRRFFAERP